MSDLLGRLAQRVVAPSALLQPRVPSLFEAAAPTDVTGETPALVASVAAPSAPRVETRVVSHHDEPAPQHDASERTVVRREIIERIGEEAAAAAAPLPSIEVAPVANTGVVTRTIERTIESTPRIVTRRAMEHTRVETGRFDAVESRVVEADRDVHITIGRIDVRAVATPPRERAAPPPARTLTLDEYLARRGRR